MAFLGILNLNNEDQVRPEEQASVVQVILTHLLTHHPLNILLIMNIGYVRCCAYTNNSIAKTSFG